MSVLVKKKKIVSDFFLPLQAMPFISKHMFEGMKNCLVAMEHSCYIINQYQASGS